MKTINTLLTATALITCSAFSTVQANGFFQIDSIKTHQKQPDTFNEAAHKGTTFWGYFNNGLAKEAPKMNKVATFDHSKHEGTAFWGVHHN